MMALAVILLIAVIGLMAHVIDLRARLSRLGTEYCQRGAHTFGRRRI